MTFRDWLRQIIRQGIVRGKPGKKLKYLTTNDLDEDCKLYPDYLARQARRRKAMKEREEENEDFFWTE